MTAVIGDEKLFEIIRVRVLKDLLIERSPLPIADAATQNSLIMPLLAAENRIPEDVSKGQPNQKLRFDAAEGQGELGPQRGFAQRSHLQKCVFDFIGPLRSRPAKRGLVEFVELGNAIG